MADPVPCLDSEGDTRLGNRLEDATAFKRSGGSS